MTDTRLAAALLSGSNSNNQNLRYTTEKKNGKFKSIFSYMKNVKEIAGRVLLPLLH